MNMHVKERLEGDLKSNNDSIGGSDSGCLF